MERKNQLKYFYLFLNLATPSTIQNVINILVNDWGIDNSTLWETIKNIYPNGPIL